VKNWNYHIPGNPCVGCPGTEYCGRKLAKLAVAKPAGSWPAWKPPGNWLLSKPKTQNYFD